MVVFSGVFIVGGWSVPSGSCSGGSGGATGVSGGSGGSGGPTGVSGGCVAADIFLAFAAASSAIFASCVFKSGTAGGAGGSTSPPGSFPASALVKFHKAFLWYFWYHYFVDFFSL